MLIIRESQLLKPNHTKQPTQPAALDQFEIVSPYATQAPTLPRDPAQKINETSEFSVRIFQKTNSRSDLSKNKFPVPQQQPHHNPSSRGVLEVSGSPNCAAKGSATARAKHEEKAEQVQKQPQVYTPTTARSRHQKASRTFDDRQTKRERELTCMFACTSAHCSSSFLLASVFIMVKANAAPFPSRDDPGIFWSRSRRWLEAGEARQGRRGR